MTQLDDDEALILAQARVGLGPTTADEQRVLQGVLTQITLGSLVPSGGAAPHKSPWPLRIAGSIAVVGAMALSGGLGYHKGWEAGIAKKNQPGTRLNGAVSAPSARVDASRAAELPRERAIPVEQLPLIEDTPQSEHEAKSASSSMHAPSASAAPSAALGLDEEVRQLRRVERALREGNPRFALALIEDLDRAMPAGQLLEERRAAGIMANCQLGSGSAVSNARAFVAKHSGSAYLTRVVEICGLESERNSAEPATNTPRSGG
ncbi:MAG TPA: hypothetical protein VER96_24240 [Polyangiaceae bacterium]|nr:hypothetical protein [Polyangiaceae bacterium]